MLALAGLMFCGVNNASMMGQEQRELLYMLHTFGQDFSQVPMITQNLDMFMGVMEMDTQLKEVELKTADKELKTALWRSAALFAGAIVSKEVVETVNPYIPRSIVSVFNGSATGLRTIVGLYLPTLNFYDAWKKRSEAMQALALNKEILSKLEEIKYSMDSSILGGNPAPAENFLLDSAA